MAGFEGKTRGSWWVGGETKKGSLRRGRAGIARLTSFRTRWCRSFACRRAVMGRSRVALGGGGECGNQIGYEPVAREHVLLFARQFAGGSGAGICGFQSEQCAESVWRNHRRSDSA